MRTLPATAILERVWMRREDVLKVMKLEQLNKFLKLLCSKLCVTSHIAGIQLDIYLK